MGSLGLKRILIANRGEIALRIVRTCKRLGIETVVLASPADRTLPYAQAADHCFHFENSEVSSSYLDIKSVIAAAKEYNCDAIHPGYGFLSENSDFAAAVEKAGITFVGPRSETISSLGDKITARTIAEKAKVPLVPGLNSDSLTLSDVEKFAEKAGFPLMIKAAAGGGGRGMRKVSTKGEIKEALDSAQREAKSFFGDARVFVERYVERGRHIEVQVIGDGQGDVRSLSDRDCSWQRRHQKVIEEAPAPHLSDTTREALHKAAVDLCKSLSYRSAGTVEFMLDSDENLYFLEVNSRLQVEHCVTEAITSLDIVELQLRVADGAALSEILPENIEIHGHAIEARICAEAPEADFAPSTGRLEEFNLSPSDGIRIDSGFIKGNTVSHYYDSLLAKLIAHGDSREEAIERLLTSLKHSEISPIPNNLAYCVELVDSVEFRNVTHHVRLAEELFPSDRLRDELGTRAVALLHLAECLRGVGSSSISPSWRVGNNSEVTRSYSVFGDQYEVTAAFSNSGKSVMLRLLHGSGDNPGLETLFLQDLSRDETGAIQCQLAGERLRFSIGDKRSEGKRSLIGLLPGVSIKPFQKVLKERSDSASQATTVQSPLPGKVLQIQVGVEQEVSEGDPLLVLESMKMEHIINAPRTGLIAEILVNEGDTVEAERALVTFSTGE